MKKAGGACRRLAEICRKGARGSLHAKNRKAKGKAALCSEASKLFGEKHAVEIAAQCVRLDAHWAKPSGKQPVKVLPAGGRKVPEVPAQYSPEAAREGKTPPSPWRCAGRCSLFGAHSALPRKTARPGDVPEKSGPAGKSRSIPLPGSDIKTARGITASQRDGFHLCQEASPRCQW